MAVIDGNILDSFGHAYFTVTLGRGMYSDTVGSPTTTTTHVLPGCSRSLQIDSSPEEYVYFNYTAGQQREAHCFYVRFEAMPANDHVIFRLSNANGNGDFGYDQSDNRFYIKAGAAAALSIGPDLEDDRWYRICFEYDTSTGTAEMRATVDGIEASVTNAQAAADITRASLGRIGGVASAATYYISSWAGSGVDGDYEIMKSWRQHRVVDIQPSADGTHDIAASGDFDSDAGTAFDNTSTNVWQFLDQQPFTGTPGVDNNVRQDVSGTTKYVEVTFENPTVLPVIDEVRATISMVEDAGLGDSNGEVKVFGGGVEVTRENDGNSLVDNATDHPGTAPTWYSFMLGAPGGTWSSGEVDGLSYRIGYSDGSPIPHWWNAMMQVLSHQENDGITVQTVVTEM